MAENTKIEWADHSASPWHGCAEVHEGCDNCYARTQAKRNPKTLGVWGPDGTRVMSASFAKNCRRWNKSAKDRGVIETVFPSICDPFEDWQGPILNAHGFKGFRRDNEIRWHSTPADEKYLSSLDLRSLTMNDLRRDLFTLIDECQSLRFLLLTKRPQNVRRMFWNVERCVCGEPQSANGAANWECKQCGKIRNRWYRDNAAIITSVSNQETADAMIPELLKCRDLVPVLGLSAEPLLGPIEFSDVTNRSDAVSQLGKKALSGIDWVICGGESGHGARACDIGWIRSIRDQCKNAGVKCFIKQLGANVVDEESDTNIFPGFEDKKGGDWDEWSDDLRVREYPTISG